MTVKTMYKCDRCGNTGEYESFVKWRIFFPAYPKELPYDLCEACVTLIKDKVSMSNIYIASSGAHKNGC